MKSINYYFTSIILVVIFFASSAFAQNIPQQQSKKYSVEEISIKGLSFIKEEDVLSRLMVKQGQIIRIPGEDISDVVKKLWKQKLFKSIQVDMTILSEDKLKLTFIVEENPIVIGVEYAGYKELQVDEIRKKSSLRSGQLYSDEEISVSESKIKKYYETEGFFKTKITREITEKEPGRVNVKLFIDEGPRMHIQSIVFYGNTAFDGPKELEWHLGETVTNNWWRNIFGRPRFKRDQFEKDKATLSEFYKEKGYRDFRVVRDSVSYNDNKEELNLHIWIEEGPQYYIRNIAWEGNTMYKTETLSEIFGFKRKDLYNQKKLKEKLSFSQNEVDISSLYFDKGYMSFRTDLVETITPGDSIDIKIFITEGELFRIRKVGFSGNTKTKDRVIRRALYTVPGDVFSRDAIIRSIRELSQLNFFDPEKITPDVKPNPETNEVDIIYKLIEKSSDTFNFSIGYGGTIGVTGQVGVTFKNFSIGDAFQGIGFQGDGQIVDVKAELGSGYNYRNASFTFTEPWAFGVPFSLGGSVFYSFYTYNGAYEVLGISATAGRRLPWPDDFFTISGTLRYQRTAGNLYFLQTATTSTTPPPTSGDEFSIIAVLSRNSKDSPFYPRGGSEFNITGQISGGPFLPGSIKLWKATVDGKMYQRIFQDLVTVIAGEFGVMGKFNDADNIPYTNYFFMGGSGLSGIKTVPLRGYPDQGVGSSLGTGITGAKFWGGTVYMKYLAEIRHPIILNQSISVYALTFFEFGNVWANMSEVNFGDLKKSWGVGVRVLLPIVGVLGLDYAFGFDKINSATDSPNQGWRFVFTFGQFAL